MHFYQGCQKLFEIYKVDIDRGIPFDGLFDDNSKGGYLVSAGTVFSGTSLLIS